MYNILTKKEKKIKIKFDTYNYTFLYNALIKCRYL